MTAYNLTDKLQKTNYLEKDEFISLLNALDSDSEQYLFLTARKETDKVYGRTIFIRGLCEISNYCKNNCYYCGIRRGNRDVIRYRLTPGQIMESCRAGYNLGFRTFVLQGGEDEFFTDSVLCDIISNLKQEYSDCAVTLSLGERSRESYEKLKKAGADRYLLRHETADKCHYQLLHPSSLSFENRLRCLKDLKELGFQTGCGFMVGSPYQTVENIASDLVFIRDFRPHMVGIGPFIPHRRTPFASFPAGDVSLTLRLLSIVRLINPKILLPSTTALNSIDPDGRTKGILAGANVLMPNLSPENVRGNYTLYDNKAYTACESAQQLETLGMQLKNIGFDIHTGRGDYIGD
ncbi:MAG: [Clostridia bacterium]|nr:[FeFe] hydrogenase H-cluster radical SAM maturase HydE [Clostridia bacterium]